MDFRMGIVTQYEPDRDLTDIGDELVRQVELARDGGVDMVGISEHHVTDDQYLLNEAVLAYLAGHIGDMGIGTSIVLLPYHNPVRIAEYGATVDVLTNGRFVLGVGQGYRDEEFHAFDIERRSAPKRLEEGVEIIKRLWTEDEVSFDGQYYQLDGISINPKPVQDPRPPIYVGASNVSSVRRAARIGDGWLGGHVPFDVMAEYVEAFRDERETLGFEEGMVSVGREVYIAETAEEAERTVREPLMRKYRSYVEWGQSDVFETDEFQSQWEELKEERFIIGTPDDVIEEIGRYIDAFDLDSFGIRTQFQGMDFADVRSSMQLYCDEVIPSFR